MSFKTTADVKCLAMKYAEKRVVTIPTPRVTAKPLTGPEPKINSIMSAIRVVTLSSMMEFFAFTMQLARLPLSHCLI